MKFDYAVIFEEQIQCMALEHSEISIDRYKVFFLQRHFGKTEIISHNYKNIFEISETLDKAAAVILIPRKMPEFVDKQLLAEWKEQIVREPTRLVKIIEGDI